MARIYYDEKKLNGESFQRLKKSDMNIMKIRHKFGISAWLKAYA